MLKERFVRYSLALFFYLCLMQLPSCGGGYTGDKPSPFLLAEQALQQKLGLQVFIVIGTVIDHQGVAVSGAHVQFLAENVMADKNGQFTLELHNAHNGLLKISADGYRTEYIPLYLTPNVEKPDTAQNEIELPSIVLDIEKPSRARMLFGGDTGFGRRYIDTDESTPLHQIPPDDPEALVKVSDPEPGTRSALQWVYPFFQEADWSSVNLETPVTDNPETPHQTKAYVFFTLPGSLPALNWLGVDYVSLGNNHLYDYLELGVVDTLRHLSEAGIPNSGAGVDSESAFKAYRTHIKGWPYAMLSANSVSGASMHEVHYAAGDDKGGAADERATKAVKAALKRERQAGYLPIYHLHTGKEYTYEPTAYTLTRLQLGVDSGAAMIVSHHPHVAQGVGKSKGVVVIQGLGNFAFDQDRSETLLGQMARVDIEGEEVITVRMLPVYLEDYRPRLIVGALSNRFIRRIGEFSHAYGGIVYPYNHQGWVAFDESDMQVMDRQVTGSVVIDKHGEAIIDVRQWARDDESLQHVATEDVTTLQLGRDIMVYGDFEDFDTDADRLEVARWDVTGDSRFPCKTHFFRGQTGLCSTRSPAFSGDSVTAYRNRIRVMGDSVDAPNKDLSFIAYIKGENAGPISIVSRYYASEGDLLFGEERVVNHAGGTFDWMRFSGNLQMPAEMDLPVPPGLKKGELNARAVRFFLHHSPPKRGDALAVFDEIAVINWAHTVHANADLRTPHAKDFIKVFAEPGSKVAFTLTLRSHRPLMVP